MAALFATAMLPGAAGAEELVLGFDGGVGYESNVLGGPSGEGDFRLRASPSVRLRDGDGPLIWDLSYRPSYEYFATVGEESGWDHFVNGFASWDVTPRTNVVARGSFIRVSSLQALEDEVLVGGDVVADSDFGNRRTKRYLASTTLNHRFSATQSAFLSGRYFNTERDLSRNVEGFGVNSGWRRALSARTSIGLDASFTRQEISGALATDATRSSDFYNVSGVFLHRFDPTLELSLSIGPSWVEQDAPDAEIPESFVVPLFPLIPNDAGDLRPVRLDTCPEDGGQRFLASGCEALDVELSNQVVGLLRSIGTVVPASGDLGNQSQGSLTYFAQAVLVKRWRQVDASLYYRRTTADSAAQELGSSSVVDIVGLNVRWEPKKRWDVVLNASWNRQESATDLSLPTIALGECSPFLLFCAAVPGAGISVAVAPFQVDNEVEVVQYRVFGRVSYRVNENWRLYFAASYFNQDRNAGDVTLTETDRYTVSVGFSYFFDPIYF